MSTLPPEELKIIKGSTLSLLLLGFDENNQAESLAGADAATFAVKKDQGQATSVLLRRTADANLSIDIPGSKLTATLSQAEADGLTVGVYVGEVAVRFGGSGWFHSRPFRVLIRAAAAPHS